MMSCESPRRHLPVHQHRQTPGAGGFGRGARLGAGIRVASPAGL